MDFVLFAITCFNRSAICSFYYFKRKCFNGTIQNHGYYTFGKPRVKPRGKLRLATTLNHGLLQFWQTKNHGYYTCGKRKKSHERSTPPDALVQLWPTKSWLLHLWQTKKKITATRVLWQTKKQNHGYYSFGKLNHGYYSFGQLNRGYYTFGKLNHGYYTFGKLNHGYWSFGKLHHG